MAQARGKRPVRIDVETERVEGTIELSEIVRRLAKAAPAEARQAKADPGVAQHVEDRLRNVGRLARELTAELEHLDAARRPTKKPGRGDRKA